LRVFEKLAKKKAKKTLLRTVLPKGGFPKPNTLEAPRKMG